MSIHLHVAYGNLQTVRPRGIVIKETEWPAKSQRHVLPGPLQKVCQPSLDQCVFCFSLPLIKVYILKTCTVFKTGLPAPRGSEFHRPPQRPGCHGVQGGGQCETANREK